ncbi:MAG TPA: flagellar protein FlgN, partial [Geobacterales bacterium]|nr:flagellar protein FlgN [Geobacterales bacterium]
EEQRCIVELDLERLSSNAREKEESLARIEELSGHCRELIAAIGSDLGLTQPRSLSALLSRLEQPTRRQVMELQQRLMSTALSVDRLQTTNRQLIADSIAMVQGTMSFFGRALSATDTYGEEGTMQENQSSAPMVRQEI